MFEQKDFNFDIPLYKQYLGIPDQSFLNGPCRIIKLDYKVI